MWRKITGCGIAAALLALPWCVTGFTLFQCTQVAVYAVAILGLTLLTGRGGQISLGHSAFFALGAYTTAILTAHAGWPYWATIPAAALVCLAAGLLFGLPALRLGGPYLALATFALALSTPQLLKAKAWSAWTGGAQGLSLPRPAVPVFLPLTRDQWLWYLVLLVAALAFWSAGNLTRGRIGRAIVAVGDDPVAAAASGIDAALFKAATFGVSALYTGVAGALGAITVRFVAPDGFGFFLAVLFLVGGVVGGIASLPGAVVGGAFVMFAPPLAEAAALMIPGISEQAARGLTWGVYGAFLILVVYVMPDGAAGLARAALARFQSRRP